VDEQLKRKMDDLKEVNWSEVTRAAIEEKVKETEMWRRVDVRRMKLASARPQLRRKVEGGAALPRSGDGARVSAIVADASVIVKWFVEEEHSERRSGSGKTTSSRGQGRRPSVLTMRS